MSGPTRRTVKQSGQLEAKSGSRWLDRRRLLEKVPLSYPTIWKQMKRGEFPAPVVVGSKNFWAEDEVDAYIASRPKRGCYLQPTGDRRPGSTTPLGKLGIPKISPFSSTNEG